MATSECSVKADASVRRDRASVLEHRKRVNLRRKTFVESADRCATHSTGIGRISTQSPPAAANSGPFGKRPVLLQGGAAPDPELKDVPFVNDLTRTPEDRQAIGRLQRKCTTASWN